uniref:Not3 domain-containing protein n=1 Tax=Rhabditophanes sp. KR3021 TaxID=114890 RepID=A0AC35UAN6_9BILA
MAEKRKLLQEIDKCYKKIDEGTEIFQDIMEKMRESSTDNQREKLQDDLKKEIKKLQRLRDQIKGWVNSSDIKDKEKLLRYRRIVETKMEEFKDVERENKTKPHSKQGLSAEEKMDPKEREKSETIEWLSTQIKALEEDTDKTDAKIEQLSTSDTGKRRGKGKDETKKNSKDKISKIDDLKKHLERIHYHQSNLEICMRLVTNEELAASVVMDQLRDSIEEYVVALNDDSYDLATCDPDGIYDDLDLSAYSSHITGPLVGHDEDGNVLKGYENGGSELRHGSCSLSDHHFPSVHSPSADSKDRHSSNDRRMSASPAMIVKLVAPLKTPGSRQISNDSSLSSPPLPLTPPPPPGTPYNSVAAGRASVTKLSSTMVSTSATPNAKVERPSVPTTPSTPGLFSAVASAGLSSSMLVNKGNINDENSAPSMVSSHDTGMDNLAKRRLLANGQGGNNDVLIPKTFIGSAQSVSKEDQHLNSIASSLQAVSPKSIAETLSEFPTSMTSNDDLNQSALRQVFGMSQDNKVREQQTIHIPPSLAMCPQGKTAESLKLEEIQQSIDAAFEKMPQQIDSEISRSYLPRVPVPASSPHFPKSVHPQFDTLEHYLKLTPETLFFTFYYMEGTRAQLLAAKALKKLCWRFHTKNYMWFQRHEEPKTITDEFEQGTYIYFDFERWIQKKKDLFTFEYRYLEDREYD